MSLDTIVDQDNWPDDVPDPFAGLPSEEEYVVGPPIPTELIGEGIEGLFEGAGTFGLAWALGVATGTNPALSTALGITLLSTVPILGLDLLIDTSQEQSPQRRYLDAKVEAAWVANTLMDRYTDGESDAYIHDILTEHGDTLSEADATRIVWEMYTGDYEANTQREWENQLFFAADWEAEHHDASYNAWRIERENELAVDRNADLNAIFEETDAVSFGEWYSDLIAAGHENPAHTTVFSAYAPWVENWGPESVAAIEEMFPNQLTDVYFGTREEEIEEQLFGTLERLQSIMEYDVSSGLVDVLAGEFYYLESYRDDYLALIDDAAIWDSFGIDVKFKSEEEIVEAVEAAHAAFSDWVGINEEINLVVGPNGPMFVVGDGTPFSVASVDWYMGVPVPSDSPPPPVSESDALIQSGWEERVEGLANQKGAQVYGRDVFAFAEGGAVPHSGLALVGEEGPELVTLPAGAFVHTAAETSALLGQGGGETTVNIHIEGIRDVQSLIDELRRELRYQGLAFKEL